MLNQEEMDELEWLNAWTDDLDESQFNRLKELEIKKDKSSTAYLQDAERRADISSSPITSQLGADRVHLSDIYAMERTLS